MAKKLKNLEDLFHHEMKDLYSAEKQLIKALPKMAKEATDEKLKKVFEDHLAETEEQLERLEKIGKDLDLKLSGHKCKAMEGLIEEGKGMIDEEAEPATKDAGLIATAQRVEHYEISGYGTAAHYARKLGHAEAFNLLNTTLKEEQKADTTLNNLAKRDINLKAMAEG
jgi:ferritin-like metal-binding protein YciE